MFLVFKVAALIYKQCIGSFSCFLAGKIFACELINSLNIFQYSLVLENDRELAARYIFSLMSGFILELSDKLRKFIKAQDSDIRA